MGASLDIVDEAGARGCEKAHIRVKMAVSSPPRDRCARK
jgi:hypothetical protein